jgi:glycosyltransferase involved in cell wall biosynthesis
VKISIITPILNDAPQVRACLESVDAQKYPSWEHIIVDGGSEDGLEEVVEEYRDSRRKLIRRPGTSMYEAIDEGFIHSSGEVQCWLNADDCWEPMALATVAKIFQERPEINWLSGMPASRVNGLIQSVKPDLHYPREIIKQGLCDGVAYPFLTQEVIFWRQSLKERVGTFPSNLRWAGDFWLWTQFAAHTPLIKVQAILGGFTRRQGQVSELRKNSYREEIQVVQRELPARSVDREEYKRIKISIYLYCIGRLWPRLQRASYFPLSAEWKKVSVLRVTHNWEFVETSFPVNLWEARREKLIHGIKEVWEQARAE